MVSRSARNPAEHMTRRHVGGFHRMLTMTKLPTGRKPNLFRIGFRFSTTLSTLPPQSRRTIKFVPVSKSSGFRFVPHRRVLAMSWPHSDYILAAMMARESRIVQDVNGFTALAQQKNKVKSILILVLGQEDLQRH